MPSEESCQVLSLSPNMNISEVSSHYLKLAVHGAVANKFMKKRCSFDSANEEHVSNNLTSKDMLYATTSEFDSIENISAFLKQHVTAPSSPKPSWKGLSVNAGNDSPAGFKLSRGANPCSLPHVDSVELLSKLVDLHGHDEDQAFLDDDLAAKACARWHSEWMFGVDSPPRLDTEA